MNLTLVNVFFYDQCFKQTQIEVIADGVGWGLWKESFGGELLKRRKVKSPSIICVPEAGHNRMCKIRCEALGGSWLFAEDIDFLK